MTRLWDCFMFRDETDMLACRVAEMDGKVYRHVLVESPVTHRGYPKPLHYQRFRGWPDRIVHVVTGLPDSTDPWTLEHHQRDAAWRGLREAGVRDEDVLLVCDVDEIPSDQALQAAARLTPQQPVLAFEQRVFAFAADWELYRERTSVAVLAGHARTAGTLGEIRDGRGSMDVVADAGWHLSWFGGPDSIRCKAAASCHVESEVLARSPGDSYERGQGVWGAELKPVDVDETWPRYIYERRCPASWFRPR